MTDTVISVENLGKKYRLRHQQPESYATLRDAMANKFKTFLSSRLSSLPTRNSTEDFWALRDITFDVPQGQAVGIIGRNGAGKSTLLKILSRITEPTIGRAKVKGRLAS